MSLFKCHVYEHEAHTTAQRASASRQRADKHWNNGDEMLAMMASDDASLWMRLSRSWARMAQPRPSHDYNAHRAGDPWCMND